MDDFILEGMFNDAVLDHFRNPRNAGDLPDATATVEVTNPVCGDVLRLSARLEGGRIAEARFKTQGCVAAIASSSVLTELLRREVAERGEKFAGEDFRGAGGCLRRLSMRRSFVAMRWRRLLAKIAGYKSQG